MLTGKMHATKSRSKKVLLRYALLCVFALFVPVAFSGCKSHKHKTAASNAPITPEENAANIARLKKRVESDPADGKSWAKLGSAYALQKNYDGALDAYKRAIQAEPDQGKLYVRAAALAQGSNKNNVAKEIAKEGLARKSVADDADNAPQLKKVLAGESIADSASTTSGTLAKIDRVTTR